MRKGMMIDFETLGLTADAVILQIGAVTFDLDSGELIQSTPGLNIKVDWQNRQPGRAADMNTLAWWFAQPRETIEEVLLSKNRRSLSAAMESLHHYIFHNEPEEIWANGADFDIPLVYSCFQTALSLEKQKAPFSYKCVRDLRTLCALANLDKSQIAHSGKSHDGYDDCIWQVSVYRAAILNMQLFDHASSLASIQQPQDSGKTKEHMNFAMLSSIIDHAKCKACNGSGDDSEDPEIPCEECNGTGWAAGVVALDGSL